MFPHENHIRIYINWSAVIRKCWNWTETCNIFTCAHAILITYSSYFDIIRTPHNGVYTGLFSINDSEIHRSKFGLHATFFYLYDCQLQCPHSSQPYPTFQNGMWKFPAPVGKVLGESWPFTMQLYHPPLPNLLNQNPLNIFWTFTHIACQRRLLFKTRPK